MEGPGRYGRDYTIARIEEVLVEGGGAVKLRCDRKKKPLFHLALRLALYATREIAEL
jgi:hypothetical protein